MKAIADTGFLVAFASSRDKAHTWAVDLAGRANVPLLTCEAVLSEASFNLADSRIVIEMVESGLVKVAFNFEEHLTQLSELATRYADRQPDFADLCLIRMSELFPKHAVITVDRRDFSVYRRNKRDVIPLITPP